MPVWGFDLHVEFSPMCVCVCALNEPFIIVCEPSEDSMSLIKFNFYSEEINTNSGECINDSINY